VVLSRRTAAFLFVTGVFQWVIWPTFLRNVWKDPRSFSHGSATGFLIVHAVLTAVSLALGTGVLAVGLRGLRGARPGDAP
jgi:cytochrome b